MNKKKHFESTPNPDWEEDLEQTCTPGANELARLYAYTRAVMKEKVEKDCHCKPSDAGVAPLVKLNDGRQIPALGLGTWLGFTKTGDRVKLKENEIERAVGWAIDAGYRHIDTAAMYTTEEQVGSAVNKKIAEGVIKREDIYITTKLWNDRHSKESVIPALRESLKRLNLTYVDLYLIHWPVAVHENQSFANIDYVETWRGMIEARDQGLTRSIGVSNFNENQLERVISLSSVTPAVLQVEINLNLQQPSLLSYCRRAGIAVTGYTPFGALFGRVADAPPPRHDDGAIMAVATRYNKTVAQVALRYEVELGVIPLPKSVTEERIKQNIAVFDFELSPEDRELLRGYDRNFRVIPAKKFLQSPYYPFEKELIK